MNPAEEKGEISNEFFKKLNQQIVQKDNLIKLLQLQIKNLKTQIDEGVGDESDKSAMSKTLEAKEEEISRLQSELSQQKQQLGEITKEKDEQIQALNKLIEEQKASSAVPGIETEDPRVAQLEDDLKRISADLDSERKLRMSLESAAAESKQLQESVSSEIDPLKEELGKLKSELEEKNNGLKSLMQSSEELSVKLKSSGDEIARLQQELRESSETSKSTESYETRILELEQDIATLKNILAEKDDQLASQSGSSGTDQEELKSKTDELNAANLKIQELSAEHAAMKSSLSELEEENKASAEMAMKCSALQMENRALQEKLDIQSASKDGSKAELESAKAELAALNESLTEKDGEIAHLRATLDSKQDTGGDDPNIKAEIEQLTNQVADQLLAIQKIEGLLKSTQQQLSEKEAEVVQLNSKLADIERGESVSPISGNDESMAGFIEFFDGVDAVLSKHPIPELQALHKKLINRLILPNEITYLPVISEEFDPDQHIATDYFLSDRFPEKCIVFELEKGYRKGDVVVKKSKVWVVQNLFHCKACHALQSNSESRFCHMCGQKITAPNGLPVDSLPTFEPTATTYLRFAERMIEKGEIGRAKEYLDEGLKLDPESIPLLLKAADVHAHDSEFSDAIDLLQQAANIKPDARVEEKMKSLEIKNTIFQQARSLNLPPDEFSKLINLIQK